MSEPWPSYWQCPECRGSGKLFPTDGDCPRCRGTGNAMTRSRQRGRPYDGAIVDKNGRLVIPND